MKLNMNRKALLTAGLGAALALSGTMAMAKAHDMGVADGTRGFGASDCGLNCEQSTPSDPKDSQYGLFTGDIPSGTVGDIFSGRIDLIVPEGENFGSVRSARKGDGAVVPCGANSKKC